MAVLVLAEHDNSTLNEATHKAVAAASQMGGDVHVLCAGNACGGVAGAAAKISGVDKVICASDPLFGNALAEPLAGLLEALSGGYSHLVAPATVSGKNIMARVAGLLDVMVITDISAVGGADTFERPIYAGNAIQTVKSLDPIKVITVRTSTFDSPADDGSAPVEELQGAPAMEGMSQWVEDRTVESGRPELASAKIVVSGGRGVGSKEDFAIIEALADKLGAAVGASRAAVDSGYAPNDYQVGQTGKVVAPNLYVAIGISGAIQHLAGMKDSKTIVAINKDEEAPIFQVADYGLVADLFVAVPELTKALEG